VKGNNTIVLRRSTQKKFIKRVICYQTKSNFKT